MICRTATAIDLPFLIETFARSFRAASTHAEGLDKERTARLLTNLLANGWEATVCDNEGMLIGWIVHRKPNGLAWYYCRDMVRGSGVGRYLLKMADVNKNKRVISPFLPNRLQRHFNIEHRPFECLA